MRILLDARRIFGCIVGTMKNLFYSVLAGAAVIATGCVKTVNDTNSFATTWGKTTITGRYQRSLDQVYKASVVVIQNNGVMTQEYIPHDSTNAVRSLQGRVNDRKVCVRVIAVDPKTSQVDVQALTKWGRADLDLVHQIEKEIALELAR